MSERARLALEPGVGEVVVAGRVEFDGHVRRGEELHDRMGNVDIRVDLPETVLCPPNRPLVVVLGEVEHDEVVAGIAQDGLLQFAVIAQATGTGELDEDVRSPVKRLDEIAQYVLERRADVIGGKTLPELDGLPRGRGQR